MYRCIYIWLVQIAFSAGLLSYSHSAAAQNAAYTDSLLNAIANTKEDTQKINLLLKLSATYKLSDVTKEFYYANEALALSEQAGWDKGKMYAHQLIGHSYNKVLAFNDAI